MENKSPKSTKPTTWKKNKRKEKIQQISDLQSANIASQILLMVVPFPENKTNKQTNKQRKSY